MAKCFKKYKKTSFVAKQNLPQKSVLTRFFFQDWLSEKTNKRISSDTGFQATDASI